MSIDAMKQALEALYPISHNSTYDYRGQANKAIDALRFAIEQAEKQEAWKPSDTAYRPGGLPQDFIKHEVDSFDDWSEWVCPDPEQYFMKCCNCGLVHEMQFRAARYSEGDECELVVDPAIQAQFRMRRIEQAEKQEPDGWITAGKHTAPLRIYPPQQEKQEPCEYCKRGLMAGVCTCKQEKQEPVAWMNDSTPAGVFARHKTGADNFGCTIPLYTAPPQRQPLTDRELDSIWLQRQLRGDILAQFRAAGRAVERKHGIGA